MAVRMSDFWRNLSPQNRVSQLPGIYHRSGERNAPERTDHLEHDHGARTDLADVVAREEGLDTVE